MLLEYSIRRRYEAGTGEDVRVLRADGADGGGQQLFTADSQAQTVYLCRFEAMNNVSFAMTS
jgi:hypothetical protein